jgi:hypothetical protein
MALKSSGVEHRSEAREGLEWPVAPFEQAGGSLPAPATWAFRPVSAALEPQHRSTSSAPVDRVLRQGDQLRPKDRRLWGRCSFVRLHLPTFGRSPSGHSVSNPRSVQSFPLPGGSLRRQCHRLIATQFWLDYMVNSALFPASPPPPPYHVYDRYPRNPHR